MDKTWLQHLPPIHHHLGGHNICWDNEKKNSALIILHSKVLLILALLLKVA